MCSYSWLSLFQVSFKMLGSRSLFVGVYLTLTLAADYPFRDPTLPWDVRTDDLLGRLTTEEIVSCSSCLNINIHSLENFCLCPLECIKLWIFPSSCAILIHNPGYTCITTIILMNRIMTLHSLDFFYYQSINLSERATQYDCFAILPSPCQDKSLFIQRTCMLNRMAWQWTETLVEIRVTLADIRGTTK